MKYTGPGGENWDVARETKGSAQMQPGETYEVSEELAERLLLTNDWEAPAKVERELGPSPDATQGAREKAAELDVSLEDIEGTGQEGRITVPDVERHAEANAEGAQTEGDS
jgi:pyruvate/2-oxoglutarate dehydrogenase complex dihydrolipoamide acyltransferase (E2) component